MSLLKRNNVHMYGTGDRAMVFAHGSASRSEFLHDKLIRRAGELFWHLGRYDMCAVSLSAILAGTTIRALGSARPTHLTRGAAIIGMMIDLKIPSTMTSVFAEINKEMLAVVQRRTIAAKRGASIPGIELPGRRSAGQMSQQLRDWYDLDSAKDDEVESFIDAMERDILIVVSLYFRLMECARTVDQEMRR